MLENQQKRGGLGEFRQNKRGIPQGCRLTFGRQARIMEQNARKHGPKSGEFARRFHGDRRDWYDSIGM